MSEEFVLYDPRSNEVIWRDRRVALAPQEGKIARALARRPEWIVEHGALLDAAEIPNTSFPEVLNSAVKHLRRRMKKGGIPATIHWPIKTRYRQGYQGKWLKLADATGASTKHEGDDQ